LGSKDSAGQLTGPLPPVHYSSKVVSSDVFGNSEKMRRCSIIQEQNLLWDMKLSCKWLNKTGRYSAPL